MCRIVHRTYTLANNDLLGNAWMPRFRCKLNLFANAAQHALRNDGFLGTDDVNL